MRVVIAEDSVLLRTGLVRLLADEGIEVVGEVGDGQALLRLVDTLASGPGGAPDAAVVDVRMPPTHTDEGIRAALVLRAQHPTVAVLVLSQYVEENYAADLLSGDTRGVGYLLKDRVAEVVEFVDALRRVAAGGTALDPEVVAQLLARSRRSGPVDALTAREREVLSAMAQGLSNRAIARRLVVSDGAVEKHVGNVFLKLGLLPDAAEHRRVLAVLQMLRTEQRRSGG